MWSYPIVLQPGFLTRLTPPPSHRTWSKVLTKRKQRFLDRSQKNKQRKRKRKEVDKNKKGEVPCRGHYSEGSLHPGLVDPYLVGSL